MKKGTYRLLMGLWILALIVTRIVYFSYSSHSVVDTYEYYAHAMIQQDRAAQDLSGDGVSSGMAYAYTQNLSGVLAFLGNRIEVLGGYQLILQIVWMIFIFLGAGFIFGRMAQMLTGTILAASPWILETIFVVSPENYFMLVFSILFWGLGVFCGGTKKNAGEKSVLWAVWLILVCLGMGMLCVWNYLGWLLAPVAICVLVKNKGHFFYGSILAAGFFCGILATLLRYARLTGLSLGEQFAWWTAPLKALPKRCQDLSVQMAAWILFAGLAGVLVAMITDRINRCGLNHLPDEGGEEAPDEETKQVREVKEVKTPEKEEESVQYVIAADGRKVALLENPLPLPKKHEKRKMDFKYHDVNGNMPEPVKEPLQPVKGWVDHAPDGSDFDDFDIKILENDDFDV